MSQRTFRNESRDDYLEAILLITGRKGYCRSTDIATELGISRPSVSVELGKLMDQGLLCFDDEKLLHLTESGKALAEMTYAKHMFFKKCLQTVGVDEDTAEREACAIEHTISDTSFQRIQAYVSEGGSFTP